MVVDPRCPVAAPPQRRPGASGLTFGPPGGRRRARVGLRPHLVALGFQRHDLGLQGVDEAPAGAAAFDQLDPGRVGGLPERCRKRRCARLAERIDGVGQPVTNRRGVDQPGTDQRRFRQSSLTRCSDGLGHPGCGRHPLLNRLTQRCPSLLGGDRSLGRDRVGVVGRAQRLGSGLLRTDVVPGGLVALPQRCAYRLEVVAPGSLGHPGSRLQAVGHPCLLPGEGPGDVAGIRRVLDLGEGRLGAGQRFGGPPGGSGCGRVGRVGALGGAVALSRRLGLELGSPAHGRLHLGKAAGVPVGGRFQDGGATPIDHRSFQGHAATAGLVLGHCALDASGLGHGVDDGPVGPPQYLGSIDHRCRSTQRLAGEVGDVDGHEGVDDGPGGLQVGQVALGGLEVIQALGHVVKHVVVQRRKSAGEHLGQQAKVELARQLRATKHPDQRGQLLVTVGPHAQQRTIDCGPIGLGGVEHRADAQLVAQAAPGERAAVGRQVEVEPDPLLGDEEPGRGVGRRSGRPGAAADREVRGRRPVTRGVPFELHPHVTKPLIVTELA